MLVAVSYRALQIGCFDAAGFEQEFANLVIGMRRRRFGREDIRALRRAYRLLFAPEGTMAERLADVAQLFPDNQAVMDIVEFIGADSARAICQPRDGRAAA